MGEPTTRAMYEARFHANTRVEGFGFDVRMVSPCGFCAAPDWSSWTIAELALNDDAPMRTERTCRECGRSGRFIVERATDGSLSAEFVQTGGPDPAEWLRPWPRRVP